MTDKINRDVKQEIADAQHANDLLEAADKVRKAGLYNTTVDGRSIITGTERDRDQGPYRHDISGNSNAKNFDQKVFMFPESYNQLRKEIHEYWPTLWEGVGWRMLNRPEEFIELMNDALDLAVVFDTEKVDFISTTYLNALRKKRGVS